MKILSTLLLAALFIPTVLVAQNLVPNPSFEEYTECPNYLSQASQATGWNSYRGSLDYFNRCDITDPTGIPSEFVGVPLNAFGWQEPATGDAYGGGYLWSEDLFGGQSREHLGAMLTEPLQPGVPVYISFKVSPTTGGVLEDMHWTIRGAGLRFATAPYLQNGLAPLPNDAAVYMSFAPMDTSAWYQVSGMFVPDSAYQFVVLGNFFADTLTTLEVLNPSASYPAAYVYYDDVCVSYIAEDCGVGTGMVEPWSNAVARAYPMPFNERCTIAFERSFAEPVDLELSDQLGRPVWRDILIPGQRSMDMLVPRLPTGVYTLRTTIPMGSLRHIALIHVSP